MRRLLKFIAGTVLVTAGASAQALPQAVYGAVAIGGAAGQSVSSPGTASTSGTNALGSVSGSATVTAYQRVSAEGSASGYPNNLVAQAYATYYFGITGPSAIDVPLILTGYSSTSAHGCVPGVGCSSIAVLEEAGRNNSPLVSFNPGYCYEGSSSCGSFTFTQSLTLTASTATTVGDFGYVTLKSYLGAINGSAAGFIDPYIAIDPTFADAALYRVVFSAGTGNGGNAVPEPATWLMLLIGFGFAGSALRQRRNALA